MKAQQMTKETTPQNEQKEVGSKSSFKFGFLSRSWKSMSNLKVDRSSIILSQNDRVQTSNPFLDRLDPSHDVKTLAINPLTASRMRNDGKTDMDTLPPTLPNDDAALSARLSKVTHPQATVCLIVGKNGIQGGADSAAPITQEKIKSSLRRRSMPSATDAPQDPARPPLPSPVI